MIGIFGGTFDPIHLGHVQVAEQVQSSLSLREVHFLPCATPVHRNLPMASAKNRLRMIELAIAENSDFRVSTLELDRGGNSYMVDTLRQIKAQNPNDTIILILGADAFNQILSWREPDQILQLAHLVVCRRPGVELDKSIFKNHWVSLEQFLENQSQACIFPLEINENPCSSTLARELLLDRHQKNTCLTPTVHQFIVRNHLYEQN